MRMLSRNLLLICTLWCAGLPAQAQPAAQSANASTTASITLAPYLQPLSPDSVAVDWRTDQPAYGWVEYGESQDLGQKRDAVVHGLRAANVQHHRVVLSDLPPGGTYWYRVCFKPIRHLGPYRVDFGPEQRSEIRLLQTLPAADQDLRVVVFNDLHDDLNTFNGLCRALGQTLGQTPFDFTLFNGDCLADPQNEDRVLASLAAYTSGTQAGSRPAVFVRGNHEVRGAYARELPKLLAWPGDKPYFAFSAGPVRFLVLDCGEDKPDDHREYSGLVDFTSFRQEQTEWLKSELASPAFREATWRVLVHHIPLYPPGRGGGSSKPSRDLWGELLADARIDVALNAHMHQVAFHPAGSAGNPYPVVVGGGNRLEDGSVMILEADSGQLKLRVLNAEGKDALPVFEKQR